MRLPLLVLLLLFRPTVEASLAQSAAEIVWNVIGIISLLRHGPDDQLNERSDDGASTLLHDANFLYETFYRFVNYNKRTRSILHVSGRIG